MQRIAESPIRSQAAAPEHRYILGTRVDATSYADAVARIMVWARAGESRFICPASAHTVMEAYDSPQFRLAMRDADLVTTDGMPLVWVLRALGIRDQQRVYGPDLMLALCAAAQAHGVPVAFYGGQPECLSRLVEGMQLRFPDLRIACACAPPFRPLTHTEDKKLTTLVNTSGARIVFVGLGCPKQEWWIAQHRGRVRAVMVGVGAAFQVHAGLVKQAPRWVQHAGMEWLFRLLMEPRRLWRRYARHHPRFAVLAALQVLRRRQFEVRYQ